MFKAIVRAAKLVLDRLTNLEVSEKTKPLPSFEWRRITSPMRNECCICCSGTAMAAEINSKTAKLTEHAVFVPKIEEGWN